MAGAAHMLVKPAKADDGSYTGEWYYVKRSANGEDLYTSETFTRKGDAVEAAERESGGLAVKVLPTTIT